DRTWLDWCRARREKYPVVLEEYRTPDERSVHPYHFIEELTAALDEKAILVAGNGTACVALFQAGSVKDGQRIFWNSGCASMGYDLPAAIGASLAGDRTVVCLAGDGSLQMNLQELQTVRHYRLPVKLFVLNNHGYRSIELTQTEFFAADFIGCNEGSGVSFPDYSGLAGLYGLAYHKINSTAGMRRTLGEVLACEGPALCEVVLNKGYVFAPKLSSERKPDGRIVSKPLEDLSPLLPREEFKDNMLVPLADE
ncbi:MAG: thiamine pyrophosphate-dependent enzyme, partial [Elusimicrobia bacterium]|nr:thiamine pyrophosphate-dependent enzyme [Elusimicrobiota bacterium]